MQGAGGVGGLLAVTDSANGSDFCAFDGNGNVVALLKASDGMASANYEYGPFGELIRASGEAALLNPLRFSTKYQDDETDLLYYGYRYYDSRNGGWPSRDPLGERGGNNLHRYVRNAPTLRIDPFGLIDGQMTLNQDQLSQIDMYHDLWVPLWDAWGKPVVNAVNAAATKAVDTCCKDKCRLGDLDIKVHVTFAPPGKSVEEFETIKGAVLDLEHMWVATELLHWAEDPLGMIAVSSMHIQDPHSIFETAENAVLSSKADMYIQFEYERCEKVRCNPFFWRTRNDWVKHPLTGWKQATLGIGGAGWFFGIDDAKAHLDENIKAMAHDKFGE
jgi:RHS repeat-associated protein